MEYQSSAGYCYDTSYRDATEYQNLLSELHELQPADWIRLGAACQEGESLFERAKDWLGDPLNQTDVVVLVATGAGCVAGAVAVIPADVPTLGGASIAACGVVAADWGLKANIAMTLPRYHFLNDRYQAGEITLCEFVGTLGAITAIGPGSPFVRGARKKGIAIRTPNMWTSGVVVAGQKSMTDGIVIHRGSRVWEKGDPWAVLVDDIVVGRLGDSESVTIRVNDGQHYVRLESAFMRSDTYLIDSSWESAVEFQADTRLHGLRWLLFPVFVFKRGSLELKPIRGEVRPVHVERGFHWRAMPHPSRRLLMVHLAVTVTAIVAAVLRVIL